MSRKYNKRVKVFLQSGFLFALMGVSSAFGRTLTPPMLTDSQSLFYSASSRGDLQRGISMFNRSVFMATLDQMRLALENRFDRDELEGRAYLMALGAFGQNDSDAVMLLDKFLVDYPESVLSYSVRLARADVWFFEGDFRKALAIYELVDPDILSGSDKSLYTYRKGLSMVRSGLCREAEPLFESLLGNGAYRNAANFYIGYIAYFYGDYDRAEKYFLKVNDESTGQEDMSGNAVGRKLRTAMPREKEYVPTGLEAGYYLTQIEYSRGKYEDVIRHGTSLLKKQYVAELAPEMNRIIGLSYFKKNQYDSALGFLRNYVSSPDVTPVSDAVYALGVIDYMHGDYESAYRRFETLVDQRDEIAQSAELYLGQCDICRGDKESAAIRFERAARMGFDKSVTEAALYNYIVSVINGNSSPFSSSTNLMEEFVTAFPNSEYTPAVRESLAAAYYKNRNYAKALECIDRIKNPSADVVRFRQKVLFELGVECVSNSNYSQGADFLRRAVALEKYDRSLAGQASLWLGDALYSQAKFKEAIGAYRNALLMLPADENRSMARYDLGYALFMAENYGEAAKEFHNVLHKSEKLPLALQNDARLREGDCLYYTGRWKDAERVYGEAIDKGGDGSDYAWWRRAVVRGLLGGVDKKLSDLEVMESRYPHSRWLPDAMLERGMTLSARGDGLGASKVFGLLADRYPMSVQSRKGMLNRALELVKSGKRQEGMEAYREVIRRWPASEEAMTANEDLQRLSAESGTLEEYVAFVESVPGAPRIDPDSIEKISYEAASDAVASNAADTEKLEKFIAAYPSSRYLSRALLSLAQARKDCGDYSGALRAVEILLDRRASAAETGEALLIKGEIIEKNYPHRLREAVDAYRLLEASGDASLETLAYAGIMRCAESPAVRLEYARKLQKSGAEGADVMEQARLQEALALVELDKYDDALGILDSLRRNPQTSEGAQAAVVAGDVLLKKGEVQKSVDVLSDFTTKGTPHQYWLARGFISLADAYHRLGRKALALEYIRSLDENYPGSEKDIRDMISKRLKSWK